MFEDRPTLSVGVAAQLLAVAVSGSVRAGQSHEFGYVDLSPTASAAGDPVLRAVRGVVSNNPAIRLRIGAEIVRHQERAERFGNQVFEAWPTLIGK